MASESPYDYKIDIRAVASALLQLAPIILVVIYILEYTYVFQFLSQFGVTPEEVGISEIKLLTRAATYTLATVSIVGLAVAIAGGIIAVQASIEESNWIQGMLKKLKRARRPQNRNQNSMTKSIETASKQAESIRDVCTASFAAILTVIIVGLKPLGIQLSILAIIALAVAWLALIATLFVGWRNKSTRSLTLACGTAIGIFLLGLAVVNGGLNKGNDTARTGSSPTFINLLGVDISEVHPEWLDSKIAPPQYMPDQDFLELGSDETTTFLYDCRTSTTYRIPLNDVVLTIPLDLNETAALKHLHCS